MVRLRHSDLRKLYQAMLVLNADVEPASLSRRTLSAVRTAVDCDFITFDSFGEDGLYVDSRWNSDRSILTLELESEFTRLFNASPEEHPLAHLLNDQPFKIQKFSDFVTTREFKKTAIYNEFFRRIDLLHQMAFLIATDHGSLITCSINRRSVDYSERERCILELLAPQLAASIRTSIEFGKLNERQALYDEVMARLSRALVKINREGEIVGSSELGERLLTKYFRDRGAKYGPSESFYGWVDSLFAKGEAAAFDIVPFVEERGNSLLRIDVIGCSPPNEITLLLYEKVESRPDVLQVLGLTGRESEILYWVAQGKNDYIIALLCDISVRTVNKHLEHIYRKLGVESRLAAIQAARELLNQ